MDLGLRGRNAIVCGASKGLGFGCAQSLAREGAKVLMIARNQGPLNVAVTRLQDQRCDVQGLAADATTDAGRAAILAACPEPDILVNNAAGPPAGDFRTWSRADWLAAIDANLLSAVFLIRAVVDGMIARRFGRVVNITSSAVKAPIAILGLSNAARSGLTGFVAGLARDVAAHNVTVNNLLPGMFDTDRLRATIASWADKEGDTAERMAERRRLSVPAGRFGTPEEFGDFCAFICGTQAGYLTGQNILLDGGTYPGTF